MGNFPGKRSKASKELEPYTKPTGLYASCAWELKTVRKMIYDRRIAPRYVGTEEKTISSVECPICLLYYPTPMNKSACCRKPICTECLLQIKPPKTDACCPYCNKENFSATYEPPAPRETKYKRGFHQKKEMVILQSNRVMERRVASNESSKIHFASVEERKKIHEELRASQPATASLFNSSSFQSTPSSEDSSANTWHNLMRTIDHSSSAFELEDMMIREAVRRSLLSSGEEHFSEEATLGEGQDTSNQASNDERAWSTHGNESETCHQSVADSVSVDSNQCYCTSASTCTCGCGAQPPDSSSASHLPMTVENLSTLEELRSRDKDYSRFPKIPECGPERGANSSRIVDNFK